MGPLALAVVRLIRAFHAVRVRYPWVKAAMLGKPFWAVKLAPFARVLRDGTLRVCPYKNHFLL